MKQILFLMKHAGRLIFAVCMMITLSLTYLSCDEVYDNIKDFSVEEIIYPAHFDTILVTIGYQRVEIDLSKYGRISSNQITLGKASKTIVEYDNIRIVYNDVYSWVNIRGLTQPKLYRFNIFTEDEYGNRSIPVEIAATPYTDDDINALALPYPNIYESTSSGMIEWKNSVSGELYDFYSYEYSYTDKDGDTRGGSGTGSFPSFFVQNIVAGQTVDVTMICKILPKISGVPILDTVIWKYEIPFTVNGTRTTLFLDKPANGDSFEQGDFPVALSWIKETGISNYTIQLSEDAGFPEDATTTITVGNVDSYLLQDSDVADVAEMDDYYLGTTFYWKVTVPDNSDIITQTRQFTVGKGPYIPAKDRITGMWSFEDANLLKASVGQNLIPHGSGFSPVAGPSDDNRAVRVDKGSYYEAVHGIEANGEGQKVNNFTVMFDFKVSEIGRYYSFIQTTLANNDDAEFFLRPAGNLGIGVTGYSGYVAPANEWCRLVISASMGNFYNYYIDGDLIHQGNSSASVDSRFSWAPEGVLFFADEDGEDAEIEIAEIIVWNEPLTDKQIAKLGGTQQ
jgi:hypothetical protein